MTPQHAIASPKSAADYPGRDADCLAALRPSVADLSTTSGEPLATVLDGEIPEAFAKLVRRAEQVGWTKEEAEAAVRHLARELEGAKGAIFD